MEQQNSVCVEMLRMQETRCDGVTDWAAGSVRKEEISLDLLKISLRWKQGGENPTGS